MLIATAQLKPNADVRINGQNIRQLMAEAKTQGARLVHFSEGSLSGYVKAQIWDWGEVDWLLLGDELESVKQRAKELGIWVVLGCNHQLTAPNRPHNSLYVISDEGEVVTRYDKQWCSNSEITDWYSPGSRACVFEIDGVKFGCSICIEIQFPELFLEYGELKIDCMLFSTYGATEMFGIQAQGHAACNSYWLSLSGSLDGETTSRMIAPTGEVVDSCKEGIASVTTSEVCSQEPRWDGVKMNARHLRRVARQGDIYRQNDVTNDPRSLDRTTL